MQRDSFIMYRCILDAANQMADRDALAFLKAVANYALNGEEPTVTGAASIAFTLIRPQIDANNQRFENGRKGGRPKKTNGYENEKPMVLENTKTQKPNVNENVNEKENIKKVAIAPTPTPRFVKPTIEDVAAYAAELRYIGFDAPAFFDFYEAKGWKVGSQPMKDWKAAVRNWERGNKNRYTKGVSRDYIQRTQLPNPEDYARVHSTI